MSPLPSQICESTSTFHKEYNGPRSLDFQDNWRRNRNINIDGRTGRSDCPHLTATQNDILEVLRDVAPGEVWMSVDTISKRCPTNSSRNHLCKRAVQKNLRILEALGEIKTQFRFGRTSVYTLVSHLTTGELSSVKDNKKEEEEIRKRICAKADIKQPYQDQIKEKESSRKEDSAGTDKVSVKTVARTPLGEVYVLWAALAVENGVVSNWGSKERWLMGRLIRIYGRDLVLLAVKYIWQYWSDIRCLCDYVHSELPNVSLFWTLREMVFGEIQSKHNQLQY